VKASDVSRLLAELRRGGLSSWTIHGVYILLGSILNHALTRSLINESPLKRLAKTERPSGKSKSSPRRLTGDECAALISATSPTYRPFIATALFTGMRQSELLGLRWQDIDLDGGYIPVCYQLSRSRPAKVVRLKSGAGERDVYLMNELASLLRSTSWPRGSRRTRM